MTMRAIQIEVYFTRCMQQSAELLGRNTTGPPRAAPGELRCTVECYRRRQDDDRRRAKQYCMASYTMSLYVGRREIIWFMSRAYWVRSDVLVHRIGS